MIMKDIPQEVLISNPKDLKYHHQRVFGYYSIRTNSNLIEWQCLLNTLKKNLFMNSIPEFLSYPYTLVKREEPDFEVVLSSGEVMLIEITRATTMKNEALKHQLSKANDDVEMAEVSNDMFTLEKPNKGEMRKNLVNKGDGLQGTGMYGWYAEKQWVSIILSAIESKRSKVYSDSVDLLLIEDRSLPYSYREAITKRFEFLKSAIESDPKTLGLNAFPNIITDTSGAIGIVRQDNQWLSTPLFLPDGWMAE
ncbi:MAG TPA: hypothetical protein PL188_07400 [Candidatus Cloacimonadota bacterium]|nr:hypothetical protein [Candidatus Cloacimonadota bacterium]